MAQEHADSSIEVLIPTFYTFPHPGVLLALSFVLFAGWYIGMNVSVAAYPTLILAGVPSLFGGTLLTIPFLLDLLKLPSDLFQVFVSVDVITTRFGTFLGAMHYTTVGLLGAIALGNENLLAAFNAWLPAEKGKGTVDALYKHWMLGEAAQIERPPRWSVIRDVLGWVDEYSVNKPRD